MNIMIPFTGSECDSVPAVQHCVLVRGPHPLLRGVSTTRGRYTRPVSYRLSLQGGPGPGPQEEKIKNNF